MAPLGVRVEFLADGRCVVGSPEGFATGSPEGVALRDHVARRLQPSDPTGGDFRCPLPLAALGARPIDLRIVLPAGTEPPSYVFPRVDWQRDGSSWVGTAALPSVPAFVSLRAHGSSSHADFGWNFYGFFVFAAAFITAYFAWARWMQRREPAAAR